MATRLPNTYVTPTPPSASETTTALNSKANSSDLSSYATLGTEQTITATKTITAAPHVKTHIKSYVEDNTNGDTWRDTIWGVGASDDQRIGMLRSVDGQTYHQIQLMATNKLSSDATQSIWSGINLISNPDGTTSESLWGRTGNRAIPTTDNSNQIATTAYVKSNLSDYVTLASAQTISGAKTFSSDLNLKPSSSSANTGGTINFHYNQSANTTSSIVENASGQIRVNGNLYLNGSLKNPITIDNTASQQQIKILNVSSASNANQRMICCAEDSNLDNKIGEIYFYTTQNSGVHDVILRAYNASTYADIGVRVDSNGNKTTYTQTPATNDNSAKIATTAFVNNRLKSVKNLGSNYVMDISDFGTTAGYYQCGSLDTSDAKNYICGTFGGSSDVGDYRFLVEGMSIAYKNILAFTPRSYEFFYGRFWNSEWQGWRVVPTVEEGTWTPVIYGADTAGAFTYTTQTGSYVKIGRLVYVRGNLVGTCTTEPVGQARLKGIPFSASESAGTSGFAAATGGSDYSMKRVVNLYLGTGSYFTLRINNKSDNTIDYANFSSTSSDGYYIKMLVNNSITLQFSCVYVTNAR